MVKKIAIFGAGVAGLSCAHTLVQSQINKKGEEKQITIYEKLDSIGGLARSSRDASGCATEYCWRVFFGFYKNLFAIMKQIPQTKDITKTTYDNLVTYEHQNITDHSFSIWQKLKLYDVVLRGTTSCQDRLRSEDCLTWHDMLGNLHESNLYSHIGEWLGMDRYNGSYNSVISVGMEMQIIPQMLNTKLRDYVTQLPTSEALFDDWKIYLESSNQVQFKLKTEIVKINLSDTNNSTIQNVVVRDSNGNTETIFADEYVFALPVQVISNLTQGISRLKDIHDKTAKLTETCLHTQLAFQVYFNKAISLGTSKNAFLFVDSPWDLIVLQYDQIYDKKKLCEKLQNVQGGWSIAVCTAYIPGKTIQKPFSECSFEEIKTEIWNQLMASSRLKEIVRKQNSFELSESLILHWAPMWSTFSFRNGKWSTTEPKFTNNAGSLKLRPSYKTPLVNLHIATGYIQETIDIFSMEAACISGKLVADTILQKNKICPKNVFKPLRPLHFLLGPLRGIDYLLFKTKNPHIIDSLFCGSSLLMIAGLFFLLLYSVFAIFRCISRKT